MIALESARTLIRLALDEDLGDAGDITTALFDSECAAVGRLVARQPGIAAGLEFSTFLMSEARARGMRAEFAPAVEDGARINSGDCLGRVVGLFGGVLAIERTLLNFLGRMCGVATLTSQYVTEARRGHPDVRVLDTRKTLPGWRDLDKYSVRIGGGENHRFGLHDAVLIKDNHLAGVPNSALGRVLRDRLARLARSPRPAFVEVEVDTLDQFEQVCRVEGVTLVLLDNFSNMELRAAVKRRDELGLRGRVGLEASGGVRLDSIASIAATGVDRISVGAITHSAPSLDLALDFDALPKRPVPPPENV